MKSKLQMVAESRRPKSDSGIVPLLVLDHKAMRQLMDQIKSQRATHSKILKTFLTLEKLVKSHVKGEETSLLRKIKEHELFEDEAMEGLEEHRIHEMMMSNIHKLSDMERKITQIKIFCEFLRDHLAEEERELFPHFRKYAALSTEKKMGAMFLKRREQTQRGKKLGVLANRS